MSKPIPRGAQCIVESLSRREPWPHPVVVSFTGRRSPFDATHIFPFPGVSYDWRWINALPVWIIATAGASDAEAMQEIAGRCAPYAGLVDPALRAVAFLVGYGADEAPKVWQAAPGSPDWCNWFSEGEQ